MTEDRRLGIEELVAPIRRRWPVVALATVLVVLASLALELRQERLYEARAQVFMSRVALDARLIGAPNATAAPDLGDLAQNQAELARTRQVAERTLAAVDAPRDRRAIERFQRRANAVPAFAGVVHFVVSDESAGRASGLATAWAQQTTEARRRLDTQALGRALADIDERLAQLGPGDRDSELYRSLIDKQQQLRTMETLQVANGTMIEPAGRATRTGGQPLQKGIAGLVVGLALGAALALVWQRLDTRVRDADELAAGLGLPLLARIPAPGDWLSGGDLLVVPARDPEAAEAYRTLRAAVELANLRRALTSIVLTGSSERDATAPVVANLGVAFARTGRRVVVVDLNLRLPALHRALGTGDRPGVTDVVRGEVQLADALVAAPPTASSLELLPAAGPPQGNGLGGWLDVLPAGAPSPEDTELIGTRALAELIRELGERYDLVLVDAAPLLPFPDTSLLGSHVDALVLVRSGAEASRDEVERLRRTLAPVSTEVLGLVVAGGDDGAASSPGNGTAPGPAGRGVEREPEKVS